MMIEMGEEKQPSLTEQCPRKLTTESNSSTSLQGTDYTVKAWDPKMTAGVRVAN